jgi:preprotein translocase subunit YajC
MITVAHAMGAGGGAGGGTAGGGDLSFIIVMAAIFAIFYFLLIRPQQKRQKEVREMHKNLNRGDVIITTGGLHGKITGLTDQVVTVEISDKVRVKIARTHIAAVIQKAAAE